MNLKIREMSWFKRRLPTDDPKPVDVSVNGLVLEQNHMCNMTATYDNGETFALSARVNQNDVTGKWTVHGIDHLGHSVLVDVVE